MLGGQLIKTQLLSKSFLFLLVIQICPLCAGPRAYEVTLEVHMTGAGTVTVANKKIVSEVTDQLTGHVYHSQN